MGKFSIAIISGFLVVLTLNIEPSHGVLNNIYSWKQSDLKFQNDDSEPSSDEEGNSHRSRVFLYNIEVWNDKLFLSLGRSFGVPTTLAYIDITDSSEWPSPNLIPYPGGDNNQTGDNNLKANHVKKMAIDACDRLWVIDGGHHSGHHSGHRPGHRPGQRPGHRPGQRPGPRPSPRLGHRPSHERRQAPETTDITPRLMVFDLKTNRLIRQHSIEVGHTVPSLVVDVTKDNCDEAFAYVSQWNGNVTVYDYANDESWTTKPQLVQTLEQTLPESCEQVATTEVEMTCITPLAPEADGYRTLYFKSEKNQGEFIVSSKILREKMESDSIHKYKLIGCRDSHPFASVFDEKTGVVFSVVNNTITCWNSKAHPNELSSSTTGVYVTNETDPPLTKIKLDGKGNIWLFSKQSHHRHNRKSDEDKVAYKISKVSVEEVIRGTVCEATK